MRTGWLVFERIAITRVFDLLGVETKFVCLTKNSYDGSSCRIMCAGRIVETGVRQGGPLSPLPSRFLSIDWTMRETAERRRNGIQWTTWEQLNDPDSADGVLSNTQQHSKLHKKKMSKICRFLFCNMKIW